jgi:hypothetical protein
MIAAATAVMAADRRTIGAYCACICRTPEKLEGSWLASCYSR